MFLGTQIQIPPWMGLDWSYFISNLGFLVAAVVSLQWIYDYRIKDELVTKAVNEAVSNANVMFAGIRDFCKDTKDIDYESMFISSEELVIGFLHSSRFIEDNFPELKERAISGKKQQFSF